MESSDKDVIYCADELYAKRQEIENVYRSVQLLQGAKNLGYEADWRLSRSFFFLGQQTGDQSYYSQGIDAGRQAIATNSELVEGHFWIGVNLALLAQGTRSPATLLKLREARHELNRAAGIDESYHAAGPLRVLGRLDHRTPGWLGGDKSAARQHYERAIEIAPTNTVTRLFYAELLIDVGMNERAQEQLAYVLQVGEDPKWTFEIERDKKLAAELLERLSKSNRHTDAVAKPSR
jgi:tetratricopeptide (TPR) repeat protein